MYLYQLMHADNTDLSCLLVRLSSAVWCKVSRPGTSTPSHPSMAGAWSTPCTSVYSTYDIQGINVSKGYFFPASNQHKVGAY